MDESFIIEGLNESVEHSEKLDESIAEHSNTEQLTADEIGLTYRSCSVTLSIKCQKT